MRRGGCGVGALGLVTRAGDLRATLAGALVLARAVLFRDFVARLALRGGDRFFTLPGGLRTIRLPVERDARLPTGADVIGGRATGAARKPPAPPRFNSARTRGCKSRGTDRRGPSDSMTP